MVYKIEVVERDVRIAIDEDDIEDADDFDDLDDFEYEYEEDGKND